MKRFFTSVLTLLALANLSPAHFVYVVPAGDAKSLIVILSDTLEADDAIDVAKFSAVKLSVRVNGKDTPLKCETGKHELTAKIPDGATHVYGSLAYGVMARKDTKPSLLMYHPKATFGALDAKSTTVGNLVPLEVVAVVAEGKVRFQLLAGGKAIADAEGSVLLPDGKKEKLKTDAEGWTAPLAAKGRVGVWLRHTETKAGEHDGKKYEEIKHYATLVADVK
jgi:uncharacterized GH25 family protein